MYQLHHLLGPGTFLKQEVISVRSVQRFQKNKFYYNILPTFAHDWRDANLLALTLGGTLTLVKSRHPIKLLIALAILQKFPTPANSRSNADIKYLNRSLVILVNEYDWDLVIDSVLVTVIIPYSWIQALASRFLKLLPYVRG